MHARTRGHLHPPTRLPRPPHPRHQTSLRCSTAATASPCPSACRAQTLKPPSTSGWATPSAGERPSAARPQSWRQVAATAWPRGLAGTAASLAERCAVGGLAGVLRSHTDRCHAVFPLSLDRSTWRPHGMAFKAIPPQPLPPAGWSYSLSANKCVNGGSGGFAAPPECCSGRVFARAWASAAGGWSRAALPTAPLPLHVSPQRCRGDRQRHAPRRGLRPAPAAQRAGPALPERLAPPELCRPGGGS